MCQPYSLLLRSLGETKRCQLNQKVLPMSMCQARRPSLYSMRPFTFCDIFQGALAVVPFADPPTVLGLAHRALGFLEPRRSKHRIWTVPSALGLESNLIRFHHCLVSHVGWILDVGNERWLSCHHCRPLGRFGDHR
uniref:Uncharacterized protein n=1 Tax=Grammatophora oceanica TaxID=210454 RepID=A0A7S1VSI8_9STRA